LTWTACGGGGGSSGPTAVTPTSKTVTISVQGATTGYTTTLATLTVTVHD
jgi:hypothetical protein